MPALEQRLDALQYDVGKVDDVYDQNTAYAVMAFQKVNGMDRTGRATDDVVAALAAGHGTPPPWCPGGGANRVEVDIARQVLFLYRANTLQQDPHRLQREQPALLLRGLVPAGGDARRRPTGSTARRRGWETGPLGASTTRIYFNGGIAIHGSRSVPGSARRRTAASASR